MPKYVCTIDHIQRHTATVEIEAESPHVAATLAVAQAESITDWQLVHDSFSVEYATPVERSYPKTNIIAEQAKAHNIPVVVLSAKEPQTCESWTDVLKKPMAPGTCYTCARFGACDQEDVMLAPERQDDQCESWTDQAAPSLLEKLGEKGDQL